MHRSEQAAAAHPVARQGGTGRRYGGKSPAERDTERLRRLLDAGLEVFGTTGYASSTIEGLCAAARVPTREFYALVGSKERLMLEVDARIVSDAERLIRQALAGTPALVEPVCRTGLTAYAAAMTADLRKARVHYAEVLAVTRDAETHRRMTGAQLMDAFAEQGRRLVAAGQIPARELSITAVALLGATRYAMTDWLLSPSPPQLSQVVDALTRLYVAGLTG